LPYFSPDLPSVRPLPLTSPFFTAGAGEWRPGVSFQPLFPFLFCTCFSELPLSKTPDPTLVLERP
jgi:hypothetical protein